VDSFTKILGAIGVGADAAATALSGDLSTAVRIVGGLARMGQQALQRFDSPEEVVEMLDFMAAHPARKASSKPAEELLAQILKERKEQGD
jgi:hypothetical protein